MPGHGDNPAKKKSGIIFLKRILRKTVGSRPCPLLPDFPTLVQSVPVILKTLRRPATKHSSKPMSGNRTVSRRQLMSI